MGAVTTGSAAVDPRPVTDVEVATRRWTPGSVLRRTRRVAGVAVLALAVGYLARVGDAGALRKVVAAVVGDPAGLLAALGCYAAAFWLRALAWTRTLPGLSTGQSWAALHVSLLGNHVLPFRLGEALLVTSVLRRTDLDARRVAASAVLLRGGDVLAVLVLALL